MELIAGIAGVGILLWGLFAGLLTRENNKAEVFSGPIGCLVNGVVLFVAVLLIWWGFF